MMIQTKIPQFQLRKATEADVPLILEFIRALAAYEHLEHEAVAKEDTVRDWLFCKQVAEVVIGEYEGEPVGFALFFYNFSTFLGKAGIYLEDLFVMPELRGKGLGKALLAYVAKLAVERGCGRVEWSCLDWNTPSIEFYKSMGAVAKDEWTGYRVTGDALYELAKEF